MSNVVLIKVILLRGDATKTGCVTDCRLRSFSDPLSSADMHHGKKSKQSIYRFLYHHPLITQLNPDKGFPFRTDATKNPTRSLDRRHSKQFCRFFQYSTKQSYSVFFSKTL